MCQLQGRRRGRRQSDMDVALMIPAGDTMSPVAARHEADQLGEPVRND